VIAVAVIVAKDASGRMAAAVVAVIAMEIGGHAAIGPPARKRRGIGVRVRGAMEVAETPAAAIPTGAMAIAATVDGRMAIALTEIVPRAAVATATAVREIVPRVAVQTVAVTAIAATSIVTETETVTVEVTSVGRTQVSRPRAFVLTRPWAIARLILRSRWPAARVMLA
jgi:hypothetical protein